MDISHDRVLIITNSTNSNISAQLVCLDSWNKAKQINVVGHSIVKTSESCSIVAKSFEISKKPLEDSAKVNSVIGEIYKIDIHPVKSFTSRPKQQSMVTPIPSSDMLIEVNNNISRIELKKVETEQWTRDKIVLTSSSSISAILLMGSMLIGILYCVRKCKRNRAEKNSNIVLNINERSHSQETGLRGKHRSDINSIEKYESENRIMDNVDAINSVAKNENCEMNTKTDELGNAELAKSELRSQFKRK